MKKDTVIIKTVPRKQENLNEKFDLNVLDYHIFWFKFFKCKYFYPLQVVGRVSETQLEVDTTLHGIT